MTKRITFHKHEVVGAKKAREIMQRLDFHRDLVSETSRLIKAHQFRFYEDTKDKTICRWMRDLGKDKQGVELWRKVLFVNLCDRKANPKNRDKPLITREFRDLLEKCTRLNEGLVYIEDLAIKAKNLKQYNIPNDTYKEVLNNMAAIVQQDSSKNNRSYLKRYLKKHFGVKNE